MLFYTFIFGNEIIIAFTFFLLILSLLFCKNNNFYNMDKSQNLIPNSPDAPTGVTGATPQGTEELNEILYFSINQDYK